MVVFMDTREPITIYELLKKRGLTVIRKELQVGDYIVNVYNKKLRKKVVVAIERKTIDDFATSIIDGRLFNQLFNLSLYFPISFLVVVGYIHEILQKRLIKRRSLIGALISVCLKHSPCGVAGNVYPIIVESDVDFADFIDILHKKCEETDFTRFPTPPVRFRKEWAREMTVAMYMCLPGVGRELAVKLYERFPTLRHLVNASIEDLATVVGRTKAIRIYEFIHGGGIHE